ncbi:hypothetical protein P153DRAFT_145916 [Dothidotthia symphoricarpi CBS 119687]|uniref:JmjC domain-containing protein n=1 Tax=Dothidotthia symphoricarpi CBS 119687 TaxID=1392245 RepID=A0A6A5ZVL7_9PLEO|nr:uncharacterized protein P153DRAFT_145916 [Dothidotthia symphoricarpi CBS 119687]KAF2123772.1 hypothetical protein P153DRAFT_145916 [Dothidotthia symphoricarpi CBS 119687]
MSVLSNVNTRRHHQYNMASASEVTHSALPDPRNFHKSLASQPDATAMFEACVAMRDRLLQSFDAQQQHMELLFHSFERVMYELCQPYRHHLSRSYDALETDHDSQAWARFQTLAERGKDLKPLCKAPLRTARKRWGDDCVDHYDFTSTSIVFCKAAAAAAKTHTWPASVIKLNQFLVQRARKGCVSDSANPLELIDLEDLGRWPDAEPFVERDGSGNPIRSVENKELRADEVPGGYRFDRFGLLVRAEYGSTSHPPSFPTPNLTNAESASIPATPDDGAACEDKPTTPRSSRRRATLDGLHDTPPTVNNQTPQISPKASSKASNGPKECSCKLVASELLLALESSLDADAIAKHGAEQALLCPLHLGQYARSLTNFITTHHLQEARQPTSDSSDAQNGPVSSLKRRRDLDDDDGSPRSKLHPSVKANTSELLVSHPVSPELSSHSSSRPIHDKGVDDHFLNTVLTQLRKKTPEKRTWDELNTHSMISLLSQAQHPRTTGSDTEVYFLSGVEAEGHLEPHVTLQGPVISQHQQPFHWNNEKGPPIKQIFERMGNLGRDVPVQDPSLFVDEMSAKSMSLSHIRDIFLNNETSDAAFNVLEMRNPLPHSIFPQFLNGEDCHLLGQIRDTILDARTAQRISTSIDKLKKWKDDEEWILLAQGGALTLPHQDSFGKGTWLTVQEGRVGFGWLSRPTPQQRIAWAQTPNAYASSQWRYVVIHPGQTIYFEPGTIHFVFREQKTPTLMFGGHLLRWSRISDWVQLIHDQLRTPNISNEDLGRPILRAYAQAMQQLIMDRKLSRGESSQEIGVSEDVEQEISKLTRKRVQK